MSKASDFKVVPISMVRENPIALRQVNKKSETYPGLVDNVRAVGILSPPTVREMKDPESGQKYYSLVDGLHRFNAAQDAGLEEIPVHVIQADEAEVLEIQLMANVHKVETKSVEYAKQLSRILANNPTMTVSQLAIKLGKSPTWIAGLLGLVKLVDEIVPLVHEGKINLSNAIPLAKLAPEEQIHFVDRAITMTPGDFAPTVNARIKELRDAKRQGREPGPSEFKPMPHIRKKAEIEAEIASPNELITLIREQGLRTPAEIAKLALEWVLSLDPVSVATSRAKAEAYDAEQKAKADQRKKEAADKKAAAAAAVQKQVQDAVAAG